MQLSSAASLSWIQDHVQRPLFPEDVCLLLAPIKSVPLICKTQIERKDHSRDDDSHLRICQFHADALMSAGPERVEARHVVLCILLRCQKAFRKEGVRQMKVVGLPIAGELIVGYVRLIGGQHGGAISSMTEGLSARHTSAGTKRPHIVSPP